MNGQWPSKTFSNEYLLRLPIRDSLPQNGSSTLRISIVDLSPDLETNDLPDIARTQIAREESACLQARRWLFCDSTPLTTQFYSEEMFGRAAESIIENAKRQYHHTILCAPDFPFSQDGTRQDAAFRQRQHDWYVAELNRSGTSYIEAVGSVESRVNSVVRYLQQ
jgi:nicotinamide riboside kinase